MVSSIIKGNQNTTKLIAELKKAANQYPTLSKDEESEMIESNKHDRDKLNDLLFMHNVRLVFNVAKKYMSKTDDFDSMVQDGMLGLAIAANNFDISRGVKFITYAMPWIKKKVLERFYIKENEITKRSVSLNAPAPGQKVNDSNESNLEDYVNDYVEPSICDSHTAYHQMDVNEQTQLCADLYDGLERRDDLTDVEKSIFIDLFYNREKTRDVQSKYGVTPKDIAVAKAKILKIMKDQLADKYGIHSFSDVFTS